MNISKFFQTFTAYIFHAVCQYFQNILNCLKIYVLAPHFMHRYLQLMRPHWTYVDCEGLVNTTQKQCLHSFCHSAALTTSLSQPKAYLCKQFIRVWTCIEKYSSKWNIFICQNRDVQKPSSSRPETKQLWECNQQEILSSSDRLPDQCLRHLSHLFSCQMLKPPFPPKVWAFSSLGITVYYSWCPVRREGCWKRWSSIQIPHCC